MYNQNQKFLDAYVIPIRATVEVRSTNTDVEFQMPDEGIRVIAFRPVYYDDNKKVVPTDSAQDLATVEIRDLQARKNYTDGAVDIYSVGNVSNAPLWLGQYFGGRRKIKFSFQVSATPGVLTLPCIVGFDLVGYLGSEEETLAMLRAFRGASMYGSFGG